MIKPTAQTIIESALATLRDEGFAGATSRAIARRGAFNQALIFYHFGSLENLLVAALEQTSAGAARPLPGGGRARRERSPT